jgi:hypothetical protein
MRNRVVLAGSIALIILAGLAIWALSAQRAAAPEKAASVASPTGNSKVDTSPDTDSADVAPASSLTINYSDSGFERNNYTVRVGETITVKNNSKRSMQFSSDDHPTHLLNPQLNLDVLSPGQSATIRVAKAGNWGAHDHLDPSKTTRLIVTE